MPNLVDVLILGGGPAGLAVASGLARQLHTAIVFSTGTFRNARAEHMHNVAGWDHEDPSKYRSKARSDILARYSTIEFKDVGVARVSRLDSGRFEAVDDAGERYEGRKVVIASGIRDVLTKDLPGYEDLWGRGM